MLGEISLRLRQCKSVDAASGAMAALAYLASIYPLPLLPSSRSSGQPDEPVARSHPVLCRFHGGRVRFVEAAVPRKRIGLLKIFFKLRGISFRAVLWSSFSILLCGKVAFSFRNSIPRSVETR